MNAVSLFYNFSQSLLPISLILHVFNHTKRGSENVNTREWDIIPSTWTQASSLALWGLIQYNHWREVAVQWSSGVEGE